MGKGEIHVGNGDQQIKTPTTVEEKRHGKSKGFVLGGGVSGREIRRCWKSSSILARGEEPHSLPRSEPFWYLAVESPQITAIIRNLVGTSSSVPPLFLLPVSLALLRAQLDGRGGRRVGGCGLGREVGYGGTTDLS